MVRIGSEAFRGSETLPLSGDYLWPRARLRKDQFFVGVLSVGILSFAVLALWDLRNYLRLAGFIDGSRRLLPSQGIADPDRLVLTHYLNQAKALYLHGHFVLLLSLILGFVLGVAVVVMVNRYFLDRRRTEESLLQAFFAMAEAVEERDGGTGRHCVAARTLTISLGWRLGLNRCQIRQLALGAQLHDLGKIAVPDRILLYPGPLSPEDWTIMRAHAERGANIIDQIDRFHEAAEIIRHHHERFDGAGYPSGQKGVDIPLGARVVAVVDSYLAMIEDRPYRGALPAAAAISELRREAGHQFDPEIVEQFISMLTAEAGPRPLAS